MTNMNINDQLVDYGLSLRESKIYLYLLKKLESPAYEIAKETSIPRATVYLTLEELKKKGLVSISRKNNVAHFCAESPNRLKKIAQEKITLADAIIPQLRALTRTNEFTPAMKLYEGKEGLKTIFDDMLETIERQKIKQIQVITDAGPISVLPKYVPEWVKMREKLGVYTQLIEEDVGGRRTFESNGMRETRIFPSHIKLDCSLDIYGDKVACMSVRGNEIYGAIIESPTIVNTIRQLFYMVWESLEPKK